MKNIIIIVSLLHLVACATSGPVISIPDDPNEFKLCKNELVKKYTDIKKYESIFRLDRISIFPSKSNVPVLNYRSLRSSLGHSNSTRYSWFHSFPFIVGASFGSTIGLWGVLGYSMGFGALGFIYRQEKVETWIKGNYEIEANVGYQLIFGEGELEYFSWKEIDATKCKNY